MATYTKTLYTDAIVVPVGYSLKTINEVESSDPLTYEYNMAIVGSGSHILAADYNSSGSRLFVNDGSGFSETRPAGDADKNWGFPTMGLYISSAIVAQYLTPGRLYYTKGFSSWAEQTPAGSVDKSWGCVAIGDDYMMAGVSGGRLYYNNGTSWAETMPDGDANKYWHACSTMNDKMIATHGASADLFYYDGSSWSTKSEPADGGAITFCSIDASGKIVITSQDTGLYYYDGSSWSHISSYSFTFCHIRDGKIVACRDSWSLNKIAEIWYYDGSNWTIILNELVDDGMSRYVGGVSLDPSGNIIYGEGVS